MCWQTPVRWTTPAPSMDRDATARPSILTAFVQAGGRLCITGQDVGSTLTQGGALGNTPSANPAAPNFLPDVLNATLASTGTTFTGTAPGARNRITGNPQFDGFYNGNGSAFVSWAAAS